MIKLTIILTFFISIVFGKDLGQIPEKHKKLFEFIKVPKIQGIPLLTSDVENFKVALSLEILNEINNGTSIQVQCIVNNLTDGKTTVQHLEEISEMLERYEYHESGYSPCKAEIETLTKNDLKDITEKLWKNTLLHNEFPSGYCRGRAFLASKILDDMGFKSKILTIKRGQPILATYKTKDGFKLATYLEHFANVVVVRENGKDVEYVIDPMFAEEPMPLNKYLKSATISPGNPLEYDIKHQSYADKLSPPLSDEVCRYNVKLLKDYEESIKDSLVNPIQQAPSQVFKTSQEAKDDYIKKIMEFNSRFN